MNNERHLRAKRSSFVINVIQTPNGFSIVEGTEQLNKPEGGQSQPVVPLPSTTSNPHAVPAFKEYKPVFKKTSLVFISKPAEQHTEVQSTEELLHTPEICRIFAPWFDLNSLHESEQREAVEWFCEKYACSVAEAEEREELAGWLRTYKRHRNFIVKLYEEEHSVQQKYLSATCIRKYLSCDAFWVMKLHQLLTNLGVINSFNPTFALESNNPTHIFKTRPDGKKELLQHQLSTQLRRPKKEDHHQVLKKITEELRPHCDYCRVKCGIVWFQHIRSLDPKEIANIMKNVNSKNPPLSQKEYQYILCVRCYCEANFPLLLTHHDFKKITVNDRIDPGRKRRNKRRRKDKRRREEGDEEQQPKEQNEEKSHAEDEEEGEKKKEQLKATISRLVGSVKKKTWTLKETETLLELVEKHEENWVAIHEDLKKAGFCRGLEVEEVIFYFLTLPQRGVIHLQEEYDHDEFLQGNFSNNRISIQDKLAERKLNDSLQFALQAGKGLIAELTEQANLRDFTWKKQLEEAIRLQISKYGNRLQHLQRKQSLLRSLHVFDGK